MKACLLGKKLGHSYSPYIHSQFGYSYQNVELDENELENFLKNSEFDCFNVTVPYKKSVMPYLKLSDLAKKIGAVNTVVKRNNVLFGYNTDYYGFQKMIEGNGINVANKKVLILGTGGASAVVKTYMTDFGANVRVVGRTSEYNYNNLYLNYDAEIIINTTPVGMYPDNLVAPLDLSPFKHLEFVGDLIYNPYKTALLLQATDLGIKNDNGLSMLVWQAIRAGYFFTGVDYSDKYNKIYSELSLKARNIILIGMPSSGKSTIGRHLAKALERNFIDLDKEIVRKVGKPIPEIFEQNGEKYFRKVESELLFEFSKLSNKVIALGGGACMQETAKWQIKQNSIVVYLTRNKISTKGRPLLQKDGINAYNKLLEIREPIYNSLFDIKVENNSSIQSVVNTIIGALNESNGN